MLEALARALQLNEAEPAHLFDLARAASTTARARRRPAQERVRPGVQQLLDAMSDVPAVVQNGRLDVLAANALGRALYADMFDDAGPSARTGRLPNHARFTFLDPRAADFYPDWNRAAGDGVALLRAEAGRNPDDRVLNELVGELTTRSERFSALWATHNVRWHTTGTKHFHHRVVGDLSLAYEAMALTADPGQTLLSYTAEPGSPSQQALQFLASWATAAEQVTGDQQPTEQPSAHGRQGVLVTATVEGPGGVGGDPCEQSAPAARSGASGPAAPLRCPHRVALSGCAEPPHRLGRDEPSRRHARTREPASPALSRRPGTAAGAPARPGVTPEPRGRTRAQTPTGWAGELPQAHCGASG